MSRTSSVSRRKQPPPPPEFFVDRSLGRYTVPEAIRAAGFVVHTLASVYGEQQGQAVPDERWFATAVSTIGSCSPRTTASAAAQPSSLPCKMPASARSASPTVTSPPRSRPSASSSTSTASSSAPVARTVRLRRLREGATTALAARLVANAPTRAGVGRQLDDLGCAPRRSARFLR